MASRIVTFNAITTSPTVRLKQLVMMMSLAMSAAFSAHALAAEVSIERVSTSSAGTQGNTYSHESHLSADGTRVAFASYANTLVAGDSNGVQDIFVKDLRTGAIIRASVGSAGEQSNEDSWSPSLSADGTRVAFKSYATNLIADDTNGKSDIFVKDLKTGTITRVSVDSMDQQGNADSSDPQLSADGNRVAFRSTATNLVAGDTNGQGDIFIKDLRTGTTTRVNVDRMGNQSNSLSYAPSLSADGTRVAFYSLSTNLVADDTNSTYDIFVKDLRTRAITRVNVDSTGGQSNGNSYSPNLSADGNRVAFTSYADNLVAGDTNGEGDIFVKDLTTGAITLVSVENSGQQGNDSSIESNLSADGTRVVFESDATNLVTGDTNGSRDIFVSELSMQNLPNLSVTAGLQSPNCSATTCTLTLPFTVVNSGTTDIDTTGLSAYAYLSADAQCATVDAYKGTTSITTIPALMPAGTSSPLWSFTLTGKVTEFRNKYACVLIDGDNKLDESDEVDNWASWRIKLR